MAIYGYDASKWGIWQLRGSDCLEHLHNQTTQDLRDREPGTGCETALVTSTARLIDLLTVYVCAGYVWLLCAPTTPLEATLGRFLPFTQSSLERQSCHCFILWGDDLEAALPDWTLPGPNWSDHCEYAGLTIARGTPIAQAGLTLLARDQPSLPEITWLDAAAWEDLRIRQGRPWPGHELIDDYNPLEANLGQTLSLTKGCYLGQETITRLHTYKGLKQQLWGLDATDTLTPGSPISNSNGDKLGRVTSVTADGRFGLGYVRTKAGKAGAAVVIGTAEATLVDLPYAQRVLAALAENS